MYNISVKEVAFAQKKTLENSVKSYLTQSGFHFYDFDREKHPPRTRKKNKK